MQKPKFRKSTPIEVFRTPLVFAVLLVAGVALASVFSSPFVVTKENQSIGTQRTPLNTRLTLQNDVVPITSAALNADLTSPSRAKLDLAIKGSNSIARPASVAAGELSVVAEFDAAQLIARSPALLGNRTSMGDTPYVGQAGGWQNVVDSKITHLNTAPSASFITNEGNIVQMTSAASSKRRSEMASPVTLGLLGVALLLFCVFGRGKRMSTPDQWNDFNNDELQPLR